MKMFDVGLCVLAVLFSIAFTFLMTKKTCHECINDSNKQQQKLFKIMVVDEKKENENASTRR